MIDKKENRDRPWSRFGRSAIILYYRPVLVYYMAEQQKMFFHCWKESASAHPDVEYNRRVVVIVVINKARDVGARMGEVPPPPLNRIKPELDIIWRDEWDYACIANGQAPQHRGSGIQWYSVYSSSVVLLVRIRQYHVCVKTLEPFSFLYFYFHSDKLYTHTRAQARTLL